MSASTYVLLGFALLLLWFPRNWLRAGLRVTAKPPRKYNQSKVERDPHDRSVKPLAEAAKARNWLDWFRAMIGTWVIADVANSQVGRTASGTVELWIAAGVLLVGVIVQMIRLEGRLSLFAPIFFLQGMNIGLNGPMIGLLVMLGSWALSPVLPTAATFLFVQGASTLCLGFLIKGADPGAGMAMAILSWVPALIAVLLRKRLAATFDKKLKIVPRDASPA